MPIRVLPRDVSSKIAAGEVIERPASVVKELLENSLDAGAEDISVQVAAGGVEEIRVADDGSGIPSGEAELAFERFATSKLSGGPDLDAISTLGFRGEALPSIAAVSDVTLVTRTEDAQSGSLVRVSDGELVDSRGEGAGKGTIVTVRHLFRSLPGRRKFLRSAAAESSRVQTLVTRYALAYPAVKFQLSVDGSTAFSTLGSGDMREVVADLYGSQVAHSMLALDSGAAPVEADQPAVSGMVSPPAVTRSSRSQITIFVNGRWVQNRMLTYALHDAYRGFLMERRFPIAVASITTPLDQVDVNVHPSKAEVRFRREGPVFSALQRAVRSALTVHSPVPELGRGPTQPAAPATWPVGGSHGVGAATGPADAPAQGHLASVGAVPAPGPVREPILPRAALPALRVLGQVQRTYIAAEGPDGVYLIDQHAAHERVLFERIKDGSLGQEPTSQSLMEPVTVTLDQRQAELAESQQGLVAGLGFRAEPFGGMTYVIRGVPSLLSEGDPGQALVDVLDSMADGGGFESWEERAAYSMACHGAIRANMPLTEQEMSQLTLQLEACQQPHTCPHGRPTMIHLTSARLEREFGRS